MTVSIWLYREFSSRNLLRRERNDVMVQMLTLPFIFVVMFCVFLYGPFCHGAHKLDLSTLFTALFL